MSSFLFEIGKTYSYQSLYAGMVSMHCIQRNDTEAVFIESDAFSLQEQVTRESSTYPIRKDENGDEYIDLYYSQRYDIQFVLRANTPDGFNNLRFMS